MSRRIGGDRRRAFTLIEILMVTMIIMILAAIVGPKILNKGARARIQATQFQMETFKSSLHEFEMNAGRLPTEQEGLQALVQRPAGLDEAAWPGRYLDKPAVPADAFGSPYRYEVPGADGYEFELTSAGPDRAFGTEADVRLSDSWRKAQSR